MSLSQTVDTSERPATPDPYVGLLLVWAPALAWLFAAGCLVGLGFAIDMSSLEQAPDDWGYTAGAVMITLMYCVPLFVPVLGCAVAGALSGSTKARIRWTTAGAVLVACCGLALAGFTMSLVVSDTQAGRVFGVGAIVIGLEMLVLPMLLVRCLRLRQSLRKRT